MSFISQTPSQLTGRYAERNKWEVLNGPGDSRPTGSQVVEDGDLVNAWSDKVVLVTGVSSGIGVETVRAIASTGATVYGTARSLDRAREVPGPVLDSGRVHLLFMDQTDLSTVRACAEEFCGRSGKLNVIINNAGVMNTPESRTKDGYELQFGTNLLSHFLLFELLKDMLLASSTPQFHSRVVNVSSSGHRYAPLNLDNVNFDDTYNGMLAYGASKTANIYMADQIERLYASKGLHAYSLHLGFFETNLQRYSEAEVAAIAGDERMQKYRSSAGQACATSVYAAVSGELEGKGGLYLEGASVVQHPAPADADAFEYGYAGWAFDQAKEEALWELSKTMVRVE